MPEKNSTPGPSLSYRDAGVDIDAGIALVEKIRTEKFRYRCWATAAISPLWWAL